jgi:hypothetical protein
MGGGSDQPGNPGKPAEDKSTPPPDASKQVPDKAEESVAPDSNTDVAPRAIRKIQDLLNEDKVTPDLEKKLGMTKDEMQQFVKKYERGKPRPAAGPGKDIKVKAESTERTFDKDRKAPETLPDVAVSNKNDRAGNVVPTDQNNKLFQGSESAAPKAVKARIDAYRSSLGRSNVTDPRRGPAPAKGGGTK